jgi:hypothetical protein
MLAISKKNYAYILSSLVFVATLGILFFMGRPIFCECGIVSLWSGDVASNQNSQQLFDAYTFTHLIHGALFYLFLKLLFPKSSFATRLLAAVFIESAWEVVENTPMVIEHYRSTTISLGYYGDSIFNVFGDIIAMAIAFIAVARMPVWVSVVAVLAIELILLLLIRDNLTLNILMLVFPIDAVRLWQAGG